MFEDINKLLAKGEYDKAISVALDYRKTIKESSKDKTFEEYLNRMNRNLSVTFYNFAKKILSPETADDVIKLLNFALLCLPGDYHILALLGKSYTIKGDESNNLNDRSSAINNYYHANEYYKKSNNALRDLIKADKSKLNDYNMLINRNNSVIQHNTTEMFKLGCNSKEVTKSLESICKINPNNEEIRGMLAISYIYRGNIAKAEEIAFSKNEEFNYYSRKAKALLEISYSRFRDAQADMEIAISLSTTTVEIVDATVLLSKLYLRNGKEQEARNILTGTLLRIPNNPRLILELINLNIATNKYTDALDILTMEDKKLAKYFTLKREDDNMWRTDIDGIFRHVLGIIGYKPENYSINEVKDRIGKSLLIEGHSGVKDIPRIGNKYKNKFNEIFDTICSTIEELKPNFRGAYDEYIVDIGNEYGLCHTVATSKFRVTTLPNTKNIVDILPVSNLISPSEKDLGNITL